MKRNLDLAQEILSQLEESDPFSEEADSVDFGALRGHWDVKEISYHLVLLIEGGFVARDTLHRGSYMPNGSGNPDEEDAGLRLTWKGHDLLNELTEEVLRY